MEHPGPSDRDRALPVTRDAGEGQEPVRDNGGPDRQVLEASVGAVPHETLPPPPARAADPPAGEREPGRSWSEDEMAAAREMARAELRRRLASPEFRQLFAPVQRPLAAEGPPALPGNALPGARADADGSAGPGDLPATTSGAPVARSAEAPRGEGGFAREIARANLRRRLTSPEARRRMASVQLPAVRAELRAEEASVSPRAAAETGQPAARPGPAADAPDPARPEAFRRMFHPRGRGPGELVRRGDHAARAVQLPALRESSAGSAAPPDGPAGKTAAGPVPPARRRLSRTLAPASVISVILLYPALVDPGDPVADAEPEAMVLAVAGPAARSAAEPDAASAAFGEPVPDRGASAPEDGSDQLPPAPAAIGKVSAGSGPPASTQPDRVGDIAIASGSPASAAPEQLGEIAMGSGPPDSAGDTGVPARTVPVDAAGEETGRDIPAEPETLPQPVYVPSTHDTALAGGAEPAAADARPEALAAIPERTRNGLAFLALGDGRPGPESLTLGEEPGQPEALRESDRKAWREVQQRLMLAGFDPGSPDGVLGPRTREAILAWEMEQGMAADGVLAADQLAMLERETEDAYRALLKAAEKRRAARAAQDGKTSGPVVHRATPTGRYIDGRGCLREPDGRAVPFYKPGCR